MGHATILADHPPRPATALTEPRRVVALRDLPLGNGNWLVETAAGQRFVLRRYHAGAAPEDLAYEHAVLHYAADAGWVGGTRASQ
jgi:Ser/Thr protein kinase RdoA (MazF antagonist)